MSKTYQTGLGEKTIDELLELASKCTDYKIPVTDMYPYHYFSYCKYAHLCKSKSMTHYVDKDDEHYKVLYRVWFEDSLRDGLSKGKSDAKVGKHISHCVDILCPDNFDSALIENDPIDENMDYELIPMLLVSSCAAFNAIRDGYFIGYEIGYNIGIGK